MEKQGELFGVHNLFQYTPDGLVAKNVRVLGYKADTQLARIREAELQIRQDNIIAEFERDAEGSDGDDDVRLPDRVN